jgi:hypothetical protein
VPIGAARSRFDDAAWQSGVDHWLREASLIVVVLGRTAGLAWEVARVAELQLWDRTLILFPPVDPIELRERWTAFGDAARAAGVELALECDPARVLLARAVGGRLDAVVGDRRDEWDYAAALDAAVPPAHEPRGAEAAVPLLA